jgi:hypothetical protein
MNSCEKPLEFLLDQSIDKLNLRNILAAYGISNDEIVKIELSTEDRIIASCNVPERSNVVPAEGSSASLSELRSQMKVFFNDGQKQFNLVEQIEAHKTPSSLVKVTLSIGTTMARKVKIPKLVLIFYVGTESPCSDTPNDPYSCCTT